MDMTAFCRRRVGILFILLLVALANSIVAQDAGGQFCARAYEDRNSNGQRDAGEPLLTRGIGAHLQDATGIILATAIIDNSPTAAQGVICFTNLIPGQYTMGITSAEYTATTLENMTANITGGGVPVVFEFGGRRTDMLVVVEQTDTTDQDILLERALFSGLGAIIAMLGTAFIGLVIYLIFLRRRNQVVPVGVPDARYMRPDPRISTGSGSMRAVQPPQPEPHDFDAPTPPHQ